MNRKVVLNRMLTKKEILVDLINGRRILLVEAELEKRYHEEMRKVYPDRFELEARINDCTAKIEMYLKSIELLGRMIQEEKQQEAKMEKTPEPKKPKRHES